MKFVFVGNGDEDPPTFVIYGTKFILNGPGVDVTEPQAIAKLKGNSHFRQGDSAEPVPIKRKPGRPPKVALNVQQVEVQDED